MRRFPNRAAGPVGENRAVSPRQIERSEINRAAVAAMLDPYVRPRQIERSSIHAIAFADRATKMIVPCSEADAERICAVINEAARAYLGVIPSDCWHEPYMSLQELGAELDSGVAFFGYREGDALAGVMGSQEVQDVTLIRHAYVRPERQRRGIGHALLTHLLSRASRPVLVGTWTSATWAIRFYERHGFERTSRAETTRLLHRYWSVPERQIEASSVLTGPGR